MFRPALLLSLALAAALAGCSSPDSRIAHNQEAFNRLPAEAQQKIRAGRIDLGFTPDMVVLALGEPARKFTRKTTAGDTEVWIYDDTGPQFTFGFGGVSGGRHSAVGGGVSISTGGDDPDERLRVEFNGGKVVTVDARKR